MIQNSSEEILDLVNENDEIIGEVKRSEANASTSLLHREIGIIIFDDQKRTLIQKRALTKKTLPGAWILSAAGQSPKELIQKFVPIMSFWRNWVSIPN